VIAGPLGPVTTISSTPEIHESTKSTVLARSGVTVRSAITMSPFPSTSAGRSSLRDSGMNWTLIVRWPFTSVLFSSSSSSLPWSYAVPRGVPLSMKYCVLLNVVSTRTIRRSTMPERSPVQGLVMSVSAIPSRPFSVGAWAVGVVADMESIAAPIASNGRMRAVYTGPSDCGCQVRINWR